MSRFCIVVNFRGKFFFFDIFHAFCILVPYIVARIHAAARKSTLALRRRKRFLLAQIKVWPDGLRASFVERFARCGKANCHCHHGGGKHGPFYFLTQCLAVGKINKFPPPHPRPGRQAAQGRSIAHYRQLQEQAGEPSQINAELLRRGEPLHGE